MREDGARAEGGEEGEEGGGGGGCEEAGRSDRSVACMLAAPPIMCVQATKAADKYINA